MKTSSQEDLSSDREKISVPVDAPACDGALSATIALAAYLKAEERGFVPGYELDDWLAAEAECAPRHSNCFDSVGI